MANLLKGIAQGTKESVQQTAKDVGRKALSTMPSPSQSMYSLGLGVGPLIKNIVEASKEKQKKSGPDSPVSKKEFNDISKASIGQTAELLQLTKQSVNILKDIKLELAKSNKAAAKGRAPTPTRATGSVVARPANRVLGTSGPTQQEKAVTTIKESVSSGTDVLGSILGGLLTAGGAVAIWKLLPDNIKDELGKSALQFADTVGKEVVDGVGSLLQKAWSSDPVATSIAAIAVAKITGLLGVATKIATGTLETGKGLYQFGKAMSTPAAGAPSITGAPAAGKITAPPASILNPSELTKVSPSTPPGGAPPSGFRFDAKSGLLLPIEGSQGVPRVAGPTGPAPGSFSVSTLPGMQGPAGPTSTLPKVAGPAPGSFSVSNLPGMQGPAGPASSLPSAAAATPAAAVQGPAPGAAAAPAGSRMLSAAKTVGKLGLVGTAASLGLSGYDYYQTGEQEKKGQITAEQATVKKGGIIGEAGGGLAGGLYGAGKGALLGSALGPIGTIAGGVIGGVVGSVAGSKLGGFVGEAAGKMKNFFKGGQAPGSTAETPTGSPSTQPGAGTVGPSPSATQLQLSGGKVPGIDNDKLLQLVRKFESGGNYGADNKVGFVGAYQTGSQMLESAGLLKPGSSKGRDRGANAAVYDPSAWVEGYSLQKYLQDKELQDKVASSAMRRNYEGLLKAGVITDKMSESDIASRLYTAWAGGVGGATAYFQRGENREDFYFKGAGTAHAAGKMAAAYGGTGVQGVQTASVGGTPTSSISPQNVQTPATMMGSALAQHQDMVNALATAMAGQNVTLNLSQIVQNAMSEGTKGGGSPLPSGPRNGNAALERQHKAAG